MTDGLKFLILDDSEYDIKLVKHEIEKYFPDSKIETALNRKDFLIKLSKFKPDVVISDYNLPDFDGLSALSITHEMYPELPFIIVTGSQNEEFGILCMKNGAYDYILKHHIKKIPIAIEEALKKYELILDNKKAYKELKESEKKFRRLAENAQDLIYRYEFYPVRGFTYVSPAATKITGYTPEDHYSDPDLGFKIVHPEDREILEKVANGEIKFDEPIVLRWIKKDGTIIWTEQRNVPIYDQEGNLIAIEGIARDITRRKQLEQNLIESESRFRLITSLITDFAYIFKVDDNLNMTGEWISDSITRVFGYTLKEIDELGGWRICFYPDDLPLVNEHAKKVLSGQPDKIECRMVTKNGEIRWVRDYAIPIFDNISKKIIKIFGVAEDITEKKKLEQQVLEREEHFEKLADSTHTAIFIYQGEHFVYLNRAAQELTGYSRDELLNMKFFDLVHPEFKELVRERGLKRQKGEKVPQNYEFKILTKDGQEKWVDFTGSLINWFGKPAGLGTAYDITPLKKAIKNTEDVATRYRTLFECAPIGILVEDQFGTILDINKKYEEITGYSKDELINQNIKILVKEENLPYVDYNLKRIINGEILEQTVESVKKDGSIIYVKLIETAITLPNGEKGILSFCQDLTNEFITQKALIESEKKFRTMFENANEGICIVNENDDITDVNSRFCEMVNYSRDELLGNNFNKLLVLPEDIEDVKIQKEKRIKKQSTVFDRRLVKKNGSIIWTKVSATPIFSENNDYKGSFAFFTDITEERMLQTKLKKSEEQFRLIWENSKDGMRLTDGEGNVILVNQAYCDMVSMTKKEIEGKPFSNIYLQKNRDYILTKHKERFATGNIKTHFESYVTLHNGKKVWFEVSNSFIQINDKKYLLGIFRDITEKKRLQEELLKSEIQFRTIWERSNDCMVLTDGDTIIRLANPAFCKMVGISENEVLNKPIAAFLDIEAHKNLDKYHLQKFLTGDFKDRFEGEMKLQSGKHISFEAVFSKIDLSDRKLFLAVFRDISERKKLINELIRAKEEAEEANRLKSGFISMMSHEIRTPLNVILGFNQVLKEIYLSKKEDDEIPKYFEAIEKSGQRLLTTINQILDISRIEAGEFQLRLKNIDLNQKVNSSVQQIKVLADNKNIKFKLSLDDNIPLLSLDEYCIDGVLINLINNAVKFSYENSTIEISTSHQENSVIFRIKDYGIGMSEEYQKHLFQPFSQEEVGYGRPYEGTGLGLALTKKFIDLMKGEIKVYSIKGEGTEFIVTLPIFNWNS